MPLSARFNADLDEVLNWVVPSEHEFCQVWSLVAEACRMRQAKVFFGAMLSHSSKNTGLSGGSSFGRLPATTGR